MLLKFTPPDEHKNCPRRQVHYGYDFSGGAVCDVLEGAVQEKLLRSGYFSPITSRVIVETDGHAAEPSSHDESLAEQLTESKPVRRKRRVK